MSNDTDDLFCRRLQVLEIVTRDDLTARAAHLGQILRTGLVALQKKHGVIGDIRGRGLLQGIEIVTAKKSKLTGPKLGGLVADRAMDLGLSCNVVNLDRFVGVFRIAPPLTVTEEEVAKGLSIMDKAFADVLAEHQ